MTKAAELAKMGEVLTNSQIGGRRNIVINGAMQVAQRATSVTGIGASGDTNQFHTVDRWNLFHGSSDLAGRLTMSQSSDTPNGFGNSMKLDCTTADTSTAAGEEFLISQKLEGQDLQAIGKGTSEAKQLVLSWYAKGTPKTYGMEMYDNDNTRHFSNTWTVTSSWQRFTQVIPADTTGAFDDDNALSLYILFWIHAGSTFSSGSSASSWASVTNANRAAGVQSFFSSTDNELYLTGVQLEVGSQATPFEHASSFGEQLALCQRYYQQSDADTGSGLNGNSFHGHTINTTECIGQAPFVTTMRATPTIVIFGNDGTAGEAHLIGSTDVSGVAASLITATGFIKISKSGGLTDAREYGCHYTANAEL
jgi:hypothetical protein